MFVGRKELAMTSRILAFIALTLVACGNQRASGQANAPTAAATTDGPPAAVATAPGCPLAVPGTVENVVDTEGGVAITFTAPAGQVDDVRARVRQMAQQGMMAACPCHGMMGDAGAPMAMGRGMGGPRMGPGMMERQGMRGLPPADARVEDVSGGARLTLTAKNPADVDALRAHVRMHFDHMKAGCPMM